MLRLIVSLTVAVTAAVSLPVSAQQSATPAPPRFAPLEFLVGHCWRGTFPDGKQTDEHCFEWVYDHKFIRDRHIVSGGAPYGGETIYSWDPAVKRIAFSYWNTEGQMMTGYVEPSPGTLIFVTHLPGEQGDAELRSTWTSLSATGYRARSLARSGSEWKEVFSMQMARVK